MTEHTAATPVTLTPLQAAWANFCRQVHIYRPHDLRALASPVALQARALDIEAFLLVVKDYTVALVEDSADNIALADRAELVTAVESHMLDLMSELRGSMLNAIHRNAA